MSQLTPAPEQPLSPPNAPETPARRPLNARAQSLGVFLLLVVAILLVAGKKLQLSQWSASADDNAAIAEAMAWRAGRLDLPHEGRDAAVDRMHDTAWYNNKVYNIFPPLMAFLSYAAAPLNQALSGRPDFWQPMLYALFAFGPLPLLGFLVFRRATNSDWRGALITLVWIAGSPLLPALGEARGAYLGSLNHVFSQTGLLLLLWDVLGKRRIWPGLAGLAIAVWSRQMTALYAPALLWAAWRGPADARGFSRNKRAFGTILGLAMIAAPLLTLNYLKFGNPLQFGYGFIYENRSAGYVEDRFRTHGVFSHHFIPENAYYQFVAPPRVALGLDGLHVSETNNIGTGILWTTPIVLWLLITLGTCLAKPNWRTLLLCSLAVMLGDLSYHSPGFLQSGYSRFALDYLPVWLVLAARSMFDPRCGSSAERCDPAWGWRNWLTAACVAWSLFYFQTITPDAFFRGVVGGEMAKFEPVLLRNVGVPDSHKLDVYRSRGGYAAAKKVLTEWTPDATVEFIKSSGLRGRGGAGFPTGMKWSFLPAERTITYLCVNADESEPGTFCNRVLMEHDPHQLLEGILISGYATRTTVAYIYMRVEFHEQFHRLQKALDEAYAAGLFGKKLFGTDYNLECYIHRGAGAYVCGEETGLIESLEGKRGWPRIKPPFPAIEGLFRRPTVVNNVETICCVPHIVERGVDWFKSLGPEGSSGPKLYTLSGPVKRPGCFEAPLGLTCRELIFGEDFGQGMAEGKRIKGCIPGGLSVGVLTEQELDCRLDFDDVRKYGLLGLGTAGAIVIPHDADIRQVLANIARFYSHESCGQCTQCREGTNWLYKIAMRIALGAGRIEDLDLIVEVTKNMGMMPGLSICGLPDGAAFPIRTIVEKFRPEFEEHIRRQEPGRVHQVLKRLNPAVYELPILRGS